MASSNEIPTITNIIDRMPENEIEQLNGYYEAMLKTRIASINEAERTQVVQQNLNFPGIAGPIYEDSIESTVDLQTGSPGNTMPMGPPDADGSY